MKSCAVLVFAVSLLVAGCQSHQPLDKASINPECSGYSEGYTVRC